MKCQQPLAELKKLEKQLLSNRLVPLTEYVETQRRTSPITNLGVFLAQNQQAEQLRAQAEQFGFRCINIRGNGNCFLRLIEVQLGISYRLLLAAIVDHIINNIDLYANVITEDIQCQLRAKFVY